MFLTESEKWRESRAKTVELCKKHGIELVFMGTPYGVDDHFVYVFQSEKPISDWSLFTQELLGTGRPDGWKNVISIRTVPVLLS